MRFGARRPKTNHVIVLNARGSWFTCGPYSGDVKGQSISLSVGVDPLLEYPTRSLAEPEPHPRKICAIISPNAHPISILRSNILRVVLFYCVYCIASTRLFGALGIRRAILRDTKRRPLSSTNGCSIA